MSQKGPPSRGSSPDSEGKDSGTSTLSPSTAGLSSPFSEAWRQVGAPLAETTVQASQQQLIERVVDHICAGLSPEPPAGQQEEWVEANNNEMSCMNGMILLWRLMV